MNSVKKIKPAKPAKPARKARPARKAKGARRLASIAALALTIALCAGCAVVRGKAGDASYTGWAFGEKTSSTLAGLNITEMQNNGHTNILERGVGVDRASSVGEADLNGMLGKLLLAGIRASGAPAVSAAADVPPATQAVPGWSFAAATTSDPSADAAPAAAANAGQTAYSTDGYSGAPGPSGEGVYGRPTCGRCQAYRAAHPESAIINIDAPANRADMWAALRRRGFTGQSVSLPVLITADSYTLSAR